MNKHHPASPHVLGICSALLLFASVATATVNHAPAIWGQPSTYARRDALYTFLPRAADADGDRLTFSIVNKPKWMWFDTRTGALKGKPKWAQRSRTFSNIVIRVSDGQVVRALPAFSITVSATSSLTGNKAPKLSGAPPLKATIGQPYYFRPTASDANGDALVFSILNKPAWATFSSTSGALAGTPRVGQAGTYGNVTIRVSDGKAMTSLQPFGITVASPATGTRSVTLTWTAPTRNTDGSALTDLAGYRVFYGTASRKYSKTLEIRGAAIQSVELQDLWPGAWYFAIRSVNVAGETSDLSGEVRATLQ